MNSILRQWYNLCWNIRGINSEDKHNAHVLILTLQVVPLSAYKKQKWQVLIILTLEKSALKGLISSFVFLLMEILGDLL
jgi:hypothetical protein